MSIQTRRDLRLLPLALGACALICFVRPAFSAQPDSIPSNDITHKRIAEKHEEGAGKKVLLYPFRAIGRGMNSSFLAVENAQMIEKGRVFSEKLTKRGMRILYGVGYDGAGLGGGIRWEPRSWAINPILSAAISVRLYQVYRVGFNFSRTPEHVLDSFGDARYRYLPQEDFYGIGPDSQKDDRTNYKIEQTLLTLGLGRGASAKTRFDGELQYSNSHVYDGDDKNSPSTQDVFSPGTVPGLYSGAELLRANITFSYSSLDSPSDPRSGVFLKLIAGYVDDLEGEVFDYWRSSFEIKGAIPLIGRGNRFGPRSTLVARVLADFNEPRGEGAVPFFDMPRLGGSNTMRGFSEFRFTDNNAALFNVEYRYPIQTILEAVLFWDEGQVFSNTADFDFGRFRSSFGGGLRVVHNQTMHVRLELAKSSEALRFIFKFGGTF